MWCRPLTGPHFRDRHECLSADLTANMWYQNRLSSFIHASLHVPGTCYLHIRVPTYTLTGPSLLLARHRFYGLFQSLITSKERPHAVSEHTPHLGKMREQADMIPCVSPVTPLQSFQCCWEHTPPPMMTHTCWMWDYERGLFRAAWPREQHADGDLLVLAGIVRDGTLKSRLSATLHQKTFLGSVTRSIISTGNRAYARRLAANFNSLEDLMHCPDLVCNGQENNSVLVWFTAFNKYSLPWWPCRDGTERLWTFGHV